MSQPIRRGQPWFPEEIQQLLQEVRKKETHEEIASKHARTPGAIRSRLRELAADYYYNDNRPIEEIMKFTGLDKETIADAISKRQYEIDMKEKSQRELKPMKPVASYMISQIKEDEPKKEGMVSLLTEIRDMMKEILVLMREKN